ncbi:MAG: hypothetical protein QJ16_C0007G0046 [archaeon GW2011_AR1]|nr:MAG: hypothetical protein QJ16_C0007G0046 [archaeon GW2011_AR1]
MIKKIDSDLYKKIVENIPIPCVDVMVFDKNLEKTLLFLRKNHPAKGENFSIGGRLHKGETLIECAQRNLEKETGLKIKKNKFFYVGVINEIFENSMFEGVSTHNLVHYFALKLNCNPFISLDNQHSKFEWFIIHDETLHSYIKEKINKSLEYFKNGKKG